MNAISIKEENCSFHQHICHIAVARWKEWMNLDCLIWSFKRRVSMREVKKKLNVFKILFNSPLFTSFLSSSCVLILVLLPTSHYTSDKCYQTDLHRIKHRQRRETAYQKSVLSSYWYIYVLSSTLLCWGTQVQHCITIEKRSGGIKTHSLF